jgi:hypothetical protein
MVVALSLTSLKVAGKIRRFGQGVGNIYKSIDYPVILAAVCEVGVM